MASSKWSLLPRYPLTAAGAPDRAWARASAQPQTSPVSGHHDLTEQLHEGGSFMSLSWRT